MLTTIASRIFLIWAMYKMTVVSIRLHKIARKWWINRQIEQRYINNVARQMKLDREGDADWLRSS